MDKRIFTTITALIGFFLCTTVFAQEEAGVEINGIVWATCNVDDFGVFAANPEDRGMLYRWNDRVAWPPFTIDITNWSTVVYAGFTWHEYNNPCPVGWRVPDSNEFGKLNDSDNVSMKWITVKGINGESFTDKMTGNSIFLPAAGYRLGNNGALDRVNLYGYYWCSSVFNLTYAWYLSFHSGQTAMFEIGNHNGYAQSVRCVVDDTAIAITTILAEESKIIGYYSITGQKLPQAPEKGIYIVMYDNGKTEKVAK